MKFKSPVYNIIGIPINKIKANAWNPNVQDPEAFDLLVDSIWDDGYTQPCVVCYIPDGDYYEIVDGFHRYLAMVKNKKIRDREGGLLPCCLLNKQKHERMASTIRHNRARGTHDISLMVNLIKELKECGMSDAYIMKKLGMKPDELLRLIQISGIQELVKNREFSEADPEL